jgi:uncharacterized protein YcbK (DUF882 family)
MRDAPLGDALLIVGRRLNARSQLPIRVALEVLTGAGTSRAGRCIGLAALALLLGNETLQNAVAEGDTRTISLHHVHTGEDLTVTYKRNGRYDDDALKQINHVLRDWRRDEEIRVDPRLIDVVWEVYREFDAKEAIHVICGYRAPATNAMLRRRSRGVAQFSQHTLGKALDFFIPGVSLEAQREAGLRLQRGGVGYYPSSGSPFVHLDVGSIRHWPRMTHDQLARVFPNGRTVHIPSDGHPLPGYALALADVEKHGSTPSQMSLDAARSAGINVAERPQRSLLASLFGAKDEDEDSETASIAPAKVVAIAPKRADSRPIPLPAARPALQIAANTAPEAAPKAKEETAKTPVAFSLASATSEPIHLSQPIRLMETANASANDVITSRGYWEGLTTDLTPSATTEQEGARLALAAPQPAPAARSAARAVETTGTVTPLPIKTADAADRVPHELALAYAMQVDVPPASPAARGQHLSSVLPRNAVTLGQSGTSTIARKSLPPPPVATTSATAGEAKSNDSFEDIWLRALVLAPDLQNYMTVTLLGAPDPRELRPLMEKPSAIVMMTFSENPHLGMTMDRFSGSAVVFVSTVTFAAPPMRRDLAFRVPSVFLTP